MDRMNRLRDVMGERGVEHLWVEASVGFHYLTGHKPISVERTMGLLVSRAGRTKLVTPAMHAEELVGIADEVFDWTDSTGPETATAAVLEDVDVLHVQGSLLASAWYALADAKPGLRLALDPGCVASLREHKDSHELEALRSAAALADETALWIATLDVTTHTERSLRGAIQARFLGLGPMPWEPLVATGANASMPHYEGGDSPIAPDRPLLCDFGAATDGYWSDITRVFFPQSTAPEVERAYETVCAAYDAALAVLAPGVPCGEVDAAARKVITDAGMGDAFIHRTGHGVGLEIHEPPYLHGGNESPLEVGHVFSIEPGVYFPGRFGLRFENVIYMGDNGAEELNRAPRMLRLG
jgi:Xaa-Pro dipeptidase